MTSKAMKILLVANMYPSKKYPHYGIFVQNTEQILQCMENVRIDKAIITKTNHRLKKLFSYVLLYSKIIFLGYTGRYDILYGHFISHIAIPIIILRKLNKKIKIVINVHGNDIVPDCEKDKKWNSIVKSVLPLIDNIIVPSDYFKKIVVDHYGISPDKIFVFPSGGVDRSIFYRKNRLELIEKYHLDSTKHYVGYVSRIEKHKGWDIFLKVINMMKDYEDIQFIVIGNGTEDNDYKTLSSELGIEKNIIKYDLLSQDEISDFFNIFDIFCFPTYRKSDSLGLVGIEAMACGALVIASNKYGPSTYMKHGYNGFTFDVGNVSFLSETIINTLKLSEFEKDKLRGHAMNTVKQYDKNNISESLINIFEKWR